MRRLIWLIPLAAFFLNPSFACTDEPQFQYGAEEMRAAVAGDWSVTITPDGGTATQVTVHIDQSATAATASRAPARAIVRAAQACGTRTLVKPAGACIDLSEMPLDVTYVSGDASFTSAALSGEFAVLGLAFVTGDLSLILGPYRILARVNADGSPGVANLVGVGQTGTVAVSR